MASNFGSPAPIEPPYIGSYIPGGAEKFLGLASNIASNPVLQGRTFFRDFFPFDSKNIGSKTSIFQCIWIGQFLARAPSASEKFQKGQNDNFSMFWKKVGSKKILDVYGAPPNSLGFSELN
jgi:hypothetical protein